MFKAFARKKVVSKEKEKAPGKKEEVLAEKVPENALEQYEANVIDNREQGTDEFPKEPRSNAPLHEDDFGMPESRHSLSR